MRKEKMVKNLKLNSKLALALIIAFSSSCSVNNLSNISEPKKADVIKLSSNESKVDFKNLFGKETNISFKVNINTNSFKLKLAPVSPGRKVDISSYKVWLCTDSTQPFSTAVTPTDTSISRDGSNASTQHSFTFVNVPATNPASDVTYYAVAQALDANGNILTEMNNGSAIPLYVGDDFNSPVSVSSNSIDINSNNIITSANDTFSINMVLKSSKPASIDFKSDYSTTGSQKDISISVNNDGNGFIVWSEQDLSSTYQIFAQRVKGFNVVGNPMQINNTVSTSCEFPSVSINSSGDGVIVWKSLEGSYSQIRMTKILNYDIDLASDNLVLSNTSNQSMPHVKINENGDGLVVWQDDRNSKWDIYAVKIAGLSIVGANFKVNQDVSFDDTINPKVYVEGSGYGIVVWSRGNNIYSTPIGTFSTLLTFDHLLISGDIPNSRPDLYGKPDGTGIVVADNNDKKISARSLSSFSPTDSQFIVSDNIISNKKNPSISFNSSSNGLVVWDDDREISSVPLIFGRKMISSNFNTFDLRITENINNGTTLTNPKVMINNSGHGFVVSQGDIDSVKGVNIRHIINYDGFEGLNIDTLSGSISGSDNGTLTDALFTNPEYMAKDSSGNIYISEPSSNRVRKIDTLGNVSTFAGTGNAGFSGDSSYAIAAELNQPSGIAVDSSDNVYIADTNNNKIRKVDASGIITTHVGSSFLTGSIDGFSTSYSISAPKDLDIDSSGNIYFSEVGSSNLIRKYSSGVVSTIVGSTSDPSFGDGSFTPSTSKLNYPVGIALDQDNNYLYIADKLNHKIKRLDIDSNIVETLVGNGTSGDVDGSITFARLSFPHDLFVMNNPSGSSSVFVTDSGNNKIKLLELNNTGSVRYIKNLSGSSSGAKDGLSHEAQFNYPIGIVIDSSNSVLISDTNNHKIRKMTKQ